MLIKSALRRTVYSFEKTAQKIRFGSQPGIKNGYPALLGISFPKSGTHLLDQILLGFSKVAPFSLRLHSFFAGYEGESGRKRSLAETLVWVDSLRPLDVTSAHLFAWDEVVARVASPAIAAWHSSAIARGATLAVTLTLPWPPSSISATAVWSSPE